MEVIKQVYAIIKTGGKQYRVEQGDVIDVEKIKSEEDEISINEVLMIADENETLIGTPYIGGAFARAKIVSTGKMEKVIIYKYKAKKGYRKKQGHRQPFTRLEILYISKDGSIPEIEETIEAEVEIINAET